MPDMRLVKVVETDILHHLQQADQPARSVVGNAAISVSAAAWVSTNQSIYNL